MLCQTFLLLALYLYNTGLVQARQSFMIANDGSLISERDCWLGDYRGICGPSHSCLSALPVNQYKKCSYTHQGKMLSGVCCINDATFNEILVAAQIPDPYLSNWWNSFPRLPQLVKPCKETPTYPVATSSIFYAKRAQGASSCGNGPKETNSFDDQNKIIGGTEAVRNSWPFMAALFFDGEYICGGSLVDSIHILTAAHCVSWSTTQTINRLEVVLGLHQIKPMDANVVKRKVRRIISHRNYDPVTMHYDIAIIKMENPVEFNAKVSPVCLPAINSQEQYIGKEVTVIGWGARQEDGTHSNVLQQVTVKVVPNTLCKKSYGVYAPGGFIVDHMLCAASLGKDACQGDSGGPLLTQLFRGGPWIQAGIVSWGRGCGDAKFPGIYTRVTYFSRWISDNMR